MKQRENAEAIMYSDEPLQVYLTLIRQVPALDDVEESLCIEHVRANDQQAEASRTRLVEANLQLVVSVAERYSSDRIHILDLIERATVACGARWRACMPAVQIRSLLMQ